MVSIVEIKSNPDDVFKAQKQLHRSEYIFRLVFDSLCKSEVSIQTIIAIPTHKNPHLLKKVREANVTVLEFAKDKDTDLSIFAQQSPDAIEEETSGKFSYLLSFNFYPYCCWLH